MQAPFEVGQTIYDKVGSSYEVLKISGTYPNKDPLSQWIVRLKHVDGLKKCVTIVAPAGQFFAQPIDKQARRTGRLIDLLEDELKFIVKK